MAPPSIEDNNNMDDSEHKRRKLEEEGDDGTKAFAEVHQLLSLRKTPSLAPDLAALTKLDLPGCELSSLPSSLPEALPNLSILFLSNNKFAEVPVVIGQCPKLQLRCPLESVSGVELFLLFGWFSLFHCLSSTNTWFSSFVCFLEI